MKDKLFKAIRGKCISDESARAVIEEVEKLYSAGEEVYVECEDDPTEDGIYFVVDENGAKFADRWTQGKWYSYPIHPIKYYLKKLTRPTPSEGEIHPVKFGRWLLKYATPHYDEKGLACWLYGTIEYDTHELYERFKELNR